MNFICCHESAVEGWTVDFGHSAAGNFASVESFLEEHYKHEHFSINHTEGLWYPDFESEFPTKKCSRWKLCRHEVYRPEIKGSYDAIIILFYEPVSVVELVPESQFVAV